MDLWMVGEGSILFSGMEGLQMQRRMQPLNWDTASVKSSLPWILTNTPSPHRWGCVPAAPGYWLVKPLTFCQSSLRAAAASLKLLTLYSNLVTLSATLVSMCAKTWCNKSDDKNRLRSGTLPTTLPVFNQVKVSSLITARTQRPPGRSWGSHLFWPPASLSPLWTLALCDIGFARLQSLARGQQPSPDLPYLTFCEFMNS